VGWAAVLVEVAGVWAVVSGECVGRRVSGEVGWAMVAVRGCAVCLTAGRDGGLGSV
jgi:hypothetical protein